MWILWASTATFGREPIAAAIPRQVRTERAINNGVDHMNLQSVPKLDFDSKQESTLDRFIGELSNTSSIWYDLKVAEMSGCDYLFVPDAICRQFSCAKSIQNFLNKIQAILGSHRTRTTVVAFWHDRYQLLHFERYSIQWSNGVAQQLQKELLDDSPQLDFIRMLYEHSEPLISTY